MAVSVITYSNANTSSRTVNIDFVREILAASYKTNTGSTTVEAFFKFTTSAKGIDSKELPVNVALKLDDLALNRQKQRYVNTANAYTDINSMVIDYVYDYVNGHAADLYSSGCKEQKAMKFT